MKRVLPGGGERKGCYPAAGKGVSFFFLLRKKKLNFQLLLDSPGMEET